MSRAEFALMLFTPIALGLMLIIPIAVRAHKQGDLRRTVCHVRSSYSVPCLSIGNCAGDAYRDCRAAQCAAPTTTGVCCDSDGKFCFAEFGDCQTYELSASTFTLNITCPLHVDGCAEVGTSLPCYTNSHHGIQLHDSPLSVTDKALLAVGCLLLFLAAVHCIFRGVANRHTRRGDEFAAF